MKAFEFRLEQVLKVKRQYERLAELRQQQARFRVEAAQAEVDALHRRVQDLAATLHKSIGRPAEPEEKTVPLPNEPQLLMAHHEQTRLLAQSLTVAEKQVQQARQELDRADAQRREIATAVEALLTLRQQQWQAHRQEVARAEQAQLDELGLRRWLAGQHLSGH